MGKVKKKKNWRRTVNKNPRIFMCDRCGRDDFTNGHALGGHKKYCQKPQYDEAREKKLKRSRKRSRLDPKANSAINRSMSKASLPNHVANLPHKLVLSCPKRATRRMESAWRKTKINDKGQFQDIEESSGREAGRFLFQVTILCRSIPSYGIHHRIYQSK